MKKLMALLLCFIMIFAMTACNNTDDTKDGATLYEQPDFTVPVTAEGDKVVTTIESMVGYVNNTKEFKFTFANDLDTATQTLYLDEALTQTEEMQTAVSPLDLLTQMQTAFILDDICPLDASSFELSDDKKVAYCKEDKLPETFQGCIVYDLSIDLTTYTLIVRGIYIIEDDTNSGTYYTIAKLQYLKDNTYKLSLRCEEYGDNNGTEYVFITTETMEFNVKDNETQNVQYDCIQDTSVYSETFVQDDDNTMHLQENKEAERVIISATVKCNDGIYTVNREMNMSQCHDSYDPNEAELIYTVKQRINMQEDGYYVLAESVDYDGEQETQYVKFTEPDSKNTESESSDK